VRDTSGSPSGGTISRSVIGSFTRIQGSLHAAGMAEPRRLRSLPGGWDSELIENW
jgi:hypothetical protein